MARSTIRSHLLVLVYLLVSPSALAGRLFLDVGASTGLHLPKSTEDPTYLGFGLTGDVSYEAGKWGLGVKTQGLFTTNNEIQMQAGSLTANGESSRREAVLGLFIRFIPSSFYLQGSFLLIEDQIQNQKIASGGPNMANFKLYTEGNGLSIGGGWRFKDSPFFVQVDYEFHRYKELKIVDTVKLLSHVAAQEPLDEPYIEHVIMFIFGARMGL